MNSHNTWYSVVAGNMGVPRYLSVLCFIAALCLVTGEPCDLADSVDISAGESRADGSRKHEGFVYLASEVFVHKSANRTETRGCPCLRKTCSRKCCPPGQSLVGWKCQDSSSPMLRPFNPAVYQEETNASVTGAEHFHFLKGIPCSGKKYVLNPQVEPQETFYPQINGSVLVWQTPEQKEYIERQRYCLELWEGDPEDDNNTDWRPMVLALVCFPPPEETLLAFFPVGMIISLPFLFVTLLVYAFVPELQTLHGKCLMMYVTGLIMAYSFLAHVQMQGNMKVYINTIPCTIFSLITYFSLMLSFFWLNVMCIDIWLTFRSLRASAGRSSSRGRRFLLYCVYAWGGPLLLTALVAGLHFHPDLPEGVVRPRIGTEKCWFVEKRAELRYFYIPFMILVISNIALFSMTAYKIIQFKRETKLVTSGSNSRHNKDFNRDKERLFVYLKLFVVMGIGWVMEWVSFLVGGPAYWWMVTDLCNTLQGVFIFFVFVFKPKVKKLIIKRYQVLRYGASDLQTTRSRSGGDTDKSSFSHSEGYRRTDVSLKEIKK